MYTDLIPHVSPQHFHHVASILRSYFVSLGYLEVHPQNRLSILAACEDPHTIATFQYNGKLWPLPQTNQMWLEHELLKNPDLPGLFCLTTSYRNEPKPVEGRHHLSFPMFEFEGNGSFGDLLNINVGMLRALGLLQSKTHTVGKYEDVCKEQKCTIIGASEEMMLSKINNVYFLIDFPEHTNPFWNMERTGDISHKCDVILNGIETIGSAERSCNPEDMLLKFITIEGGRYKQQLYNLFGYDRVVAELNEFLANKFFPRFGGGIGITRLIRSLMLEGLIKN